MGVGVGEAGSGPAAQSLLADYFRRHELGRAMGVLSLGSTLGTATGLIQLGRRFQVFLDEHVTFGRSDWGSDAT